MTTPRAWVELMALERVDDTSSSSDNAPEKVERFRSLAAPYPPGGGTRSFGGHVYAQSAYAAAQTVGKGLVVHVSLLIKFPWPFTPPDFFFSNILHTTERRKEKKS